MSHNLFTGNGSDNNHSYSNSGNMQIGKLSAGILNMKIDTFDSRTTPSEGTIPGLNIAVGNPLGLHSSGKGKSSKKKVRVQYFKQILGLIAVILAHNHLGALQVIILNIFRTKINLL